MPKIRFGPFIEDARGALGAFYLSRNTAAHTMSAICHRQPHISPLTALARANFTTVTQAWRALSAAQRADWNTLAATPPETDLDPWDETSPRTGFSWFVRVALRQLSVAQDLPTAPPADAQPDPPTINSVTLAPFGSANSASFVDFSTPLPNLIPNGALEAPYTAGVADQWTVTVPAQLTPTEETVDVYQGASAQKATVTTGPSAPIIRSAALTIDSTNQHAFSCAYKVLSNKINTIALLSPGPLYTVIYSTLTNPAWTPTETLITPPATGTSYIYIQTNPSTTATYLLDAFSLTAPIFYVLSAALETSPGRQTPARNYKILASGYPDTPTKLYIGDAITAAFGAYPPNWTLHFKLASQTLTGIRSTHVTTTEITT